MSDGLPKHKEQVEGFRGGP